MAELEVSKMDEKIHEIYTKMKLYATSRGDITLINFQSLIVKAMQLADQINKKKCSGAQKKEIVLSTMLVIVNDFGCDFVQTGDIEAIIEVMYEVNAHIVNKKSCC